MPDNQKINSILEKANNLEFLTFNECLLLYQHASLSQLLFAANQIRQKIHPNNIVSYIIDRNINLTNVCVSNCLFCNFCRNKNSEQAYVLSIEEYIEKIEHLKSLGGNQILLQGGMNPALDLEYFETLFKKLKKYYPDLKLHALGPPEIAFLAKQEGISTKRCLQILINAGLDSLPGGGAEILSDRVRKLVSPAKVCSEQWLNIMHEAHQLGLTTSATMMYGHLETIEERIEHFLKLRDIQKIKPENSKGFISFTSWSLAGKNTRLLKKYPDIKTVNSTEFLKMLALSRIILINIPNIQVSWLTRGEEIAKLALHGGANDMSSIMIEENVVSQAGKNFKLGVKEMEETILEAGFIPQLRNQEYEYL